MTEPSKNFGPFDPCGHSLEPELQTATPRSIPDLLRQEPDDPEDVA